LAQVFAGKRVSTTLRIAAAQYDIGFLKSWEQYVAKIDHWVSEAVSNRAKVLLFPEYFSMELASLFPESVYRSLARQLSEMQTVLADFMALHAGLARQHSVYIVAGSFPVHQTDGSYRNRSFMFRPDGSHDYQDKLQMTRFETERWKISAGDEIKTFDTEFGCIGINICYDSEFPMLARMQVEAGAKLILVPSCTDNLAGYWRVRVGSQARALENQCYVVQAPTVGQAPWSKAVDINIGAAGIFTPIDKGFPDNGVLMLGEMDQTQWIYADLDFDAIDRVRKRGRVLNYKDWPGQFRF
jgi:predicted amidohydrolase